MTGNRISQTRIIWAAVCGLVAFVLAKLAMGYGFWFSLLIGLVVVAIVLLLTMVFAGAAGGVEAPAAPAPAEVKPAVPEPATPVPPAPMPAAAVPAAPMPAAPVPAAEVPEPVPAAPESAPAPLAAPVAPAADMAPDAADDLKEIEGIGPALEALLNGMGVTRFAQIAAWSEAEVAAVDAQLGRFRGRIARDRWVAQARIIVTEGLEAFRERARTKDY